MVGKEYVSIKEVIKNTFGNDKFAIQKFADYRQIGRTQVMRWINQNAVFLNGDPDGWPKVDAQKGKRKNNITKQP